jgi:tocopherol O-methyltransferase
MISQETVPTWDEIARHYDDLDYFYRDIWGTHIHHGLFDRRGLSQQEACEALVEFMAKLAGPLEGRNVIDVGCGYGEGSRLLADRFGAKVSGYTLSAKQFRYAVDHHGSETVRFFLQDFFENSLPDGEVDAVFAVEPLEHFPNKEVFFAESRRILKPGGALVYSAWATADELKNWQKTRILGPILEEGRLPNLLSMSDFRSATQGQGLEVEEFFDLSDVVWRTWLICATKMIGRLFTNSRYLKFFCNPRQPNRVFAVTVFRILAAYLTGSMKYVVVKARKGYS